MYAVTVNFSIDPVHINEFMDAMRLQAKNSLALEADCHYFDIAQGENESSDVFLYELYTDREAFDAHLASAHFRQFNETVANWILEKDIRGWHRDSSSISV